MKPTIDFRSDYLYLVVGERHTMTNMKSVRVGDENFLVVEQIENDEPMLIDVHGDNWCVLGNRRLRNLIYNPLLYSKRRIFGFPLDEQVQNLSRR